jgi:hypothetical protein
VARVVELITTAGRAVRLGPGGTAVIEKLAAAIQSRGSNRSTLPQSCPLE